MVYVDQIRPTIKNRNWRYDQGCHMFATTRQELVEFAVSIGLKAHWLQHSRDKTPHFDLTVNMRRKAVKAGAIEAEFTDIMRQIKHD